MGVIQKRTVQVSFVGAGPGDPELITVRGRRVIEEADLVLYAGSLVPREVVACARAEARVEDSSSMTLEETHALMKETVRKGGLVARVHTGDPSLYGAVQEQTALLEQDGISYQVIPGVTVAFAAAAAAGVSFTLPEKTQSLILTRLEGRTLVPERERLREMARHQASMAVYLSTGDPEGVVRELRAGGYPEGTPVVMAYRVGWPDEKVVFAHLSNLQEIVSREAITRQAVFLVLPGQGEDPAFSRLYSKDFQHGFRGAAEEGPEAGGPIPTGQPKAPLQNAERGTAVYALTPRGARLARTLADGLGGDLFLPEALAREYGATAFGRLFDAVAENVPHYPRQVFVTASGIAVRAMAPHIRSKDRDPAVVVLDTEGRFAVSLLSGHVGGANDLARQAARITGGEAVITTATDTAGLKSWDELALEKDLVIDDLRAVKNLNMALLRGEAAAVWDPEDRLGLTGSEDPAFPIVRAAAEDALSSDGPAVRVTWRAVSGPRTDTCLVLHPRCLVAGVGCNRGTAAAEILDLVRETFAEHGLSPASLSCLTTLDAKKDEAGLLEAAKALGVPVVFYSPEEVQDVKVPNPSDAVHRHMGVESVCEATALKRAATQRLLVQKVRSRNATLAVALEGST